MTGRTVMITIGMMMIKMIETMEGEMVVGEENAVAERVIRTMMTMITTGIMTIKMVVIEAVTKEVIVGENLVKENAAKIVG
jgi:uncharacterized protein YjcR